MAKASELSDKDLLELIAKHEKILKKLYKERQNRNLGGENNSFQEFSYPSNSDGSIPEQFAFNLEKEGIQQDDILKHNDPKNTKDDKSATYRITQLLSLSDEQREELNKAQEKRRKEEQKLKEEKEKNKDKPRGRFG